MELHVTPGARELPAWSGDWNTPVIGRPVIVKGEKQKKGKTGWTNSIKGKSRTFNQILLSKGEQTQFCFRNYLYKTFNQKLQIFSVKASLGLV